MIRQTEGVKMIRKEGSTLSNIMIAGAGVLVPGRGRDMKGRVKIKINVN